MALDFYFRHYKQEYRNSIASLTEQPEYMQLLLPNFTPTSKELADWAATSFITNSSHPEQLQYKTSSGIFVRSKSETIIELMLHVHGLPYRYECALTLGEVTLFPDFTIRHPLTGEFFYWEHFGMMDEPAYRKNALSKLQLYTNHDIFPTINLITTYETQETPLNPEYVDMLIKHFFC